MNSQLDSENALSPVSNNFTVRTAEPTGGQLQTAKFGKIVIDLNGALTSSR